MDVTLVNHTPNPTWAVWLACKACTGEEIPFSTPLLGEDFLSPGFEPEAATVRSAIASGHTSVLEHASFTFAVEGISLVTSHQLVRHRMASYSQRSMRYVKVEEPEFVMPVSMANCTKFRDRFRTHMTNCWWAYKLYIEGGIPPEDARYVLPVAAKTNILVTMNARELVTAFFPERLCNRAQWEIQHMAEVMLKLCKETAPILFETAGAPCETGKCTEKNPCGRPRG